MLKLDSPRHLMLLKHIRIFLLFLLIVCLAGGCSRTSLDKQFVSTKNNQVSARSAGGCKQGFLGADKGDLTIAAKGINPDKIAIFDWNIYKGQLQGWRSDLSILTRTSDIVLLQEAPNNEQMRDFLHQQSLYWNFNSAFSYIGIESGVLAASLTEPLYSCGLRQDEPIIGLPKTALINTYAIKGSSEKLLVANVHGINITLGTEAYKEQFGKLQHVLRQHNGPMIVAGDFNNWGNKRKAIVDTLVGNLDLTPVPFKNEHRTRVFGDPVDNVLYRGLYPISFTSHSVVSSDHNPITVTFRLARK